LDDKGERYFAWQGADGIEHERYNRFIWEPHISANDDVLDFGCGGGFLLNGLEARRKVGVEVNPTALACARSLGLEVYSSVGEVPRQFDKVISSHAIEHVPHPRQALLDLKDKLRGADSRLVVLLPLDDWRTAANRRYRPNDMHMHLHTWTPSTLGNLISTCDLDVLDVHIIVHAWPPGHRQLWKISPSVFHAAARLWSRWKRMRQLLAVAALKR
jgi:SAM-dependent methyltransferase